MKKGFRFGIDDRRHYTGAEIYVRIFQIVSLFPLPYIFAATAHPNILTSRNILSILFDVGISAVPRAEAIAFSRRYYYSLSEEEIYFALLAIALVLGIVAGRVLTDGQKKGIIARRVFAVLIAADLVIRLIPVKANIAMGLSAEVIGFIVRAACLYLVVMDLRADKVHANQPHNQ